MDLTETQREFVRQHRRESAAAIAKALGVPVKTVRRALREFREVRGMGRAAALGAVVLGLVGGLVAFAVSRRPLPPSLPSRESKAELYAALTSGTTDRVGEARGALTSNDDSVRLAAVRYLLSLGTATPEVLRSIDDRAPRVRLATLQLLAHARGEGIEERLATVAATPQRSIGERTLALESLSRRPGPAVRPHATLLLPTLDEPQFRETVHNLLASTFPELPAQPDRASWTKVLAVHR